MSLIKKTLQRQRVENIAFSDEDSIGSDYSFTSSIDEENNDEYKNQFWHFKEHMAQYFEQNPELKNTIRFDPFDERIFDSEHQQEVSQQYQLDTGNIKRKKETQEKNHLWNAISKDIVTTGQQSSQIPSLEIVNQRLNIFKKKIEKVDYLEILQRENLIEKNQNKSSHRASTPESLNKGSRRAFLDGNMEYYSYKKTQQLKLHKMRAKQQQKDQIKKQRGRRNLFIRGKSAAADLQSRPDFRSPDGRLVISKVASSRRQQKLPEEKEKQNLESKYNKQVTIESNMEFQTPIGQCLYNQLKISGDDSEKFRSSAFSMLETYKESRPEYKNKRFPPTINKFTSDETKFLNILMPDFQNPMLSQNKNISFDNLENYQLPSDVTESQHTKTIDKIINGKVLQVWKDTHNS